MDGALRAVLRPVREPWVPRPLPGSSCCRARRPSSSPPLPPLRWQRQLVAGCSCLSNSTEENIARPPTWRETIRGALFWANWRHWDEVPSSLYWLAVFVILKIVGTIGGYRGRAYFARRSGLKGLLERRQQAAEAVDATAETHADGFESVAAKVAGAGTDSGPALAVVLPVLARTAADVAELRSTLAALAGQSRLPDAVIVVDDGSPRSLEPALRAWSDAASVACVRMARNTGPAGARTVGLRLLRRWAKGRRVIACLTDADAAPHERWCEAMLGAQLRFPGIICGPTLSLSRGCHTGRFHDHFGNLNGRWKWEDLPGVLLYGCTCNFSADLQALGDLEFDPVFSRPGFEDIELCWRARQELKVLTRYCNAARVFHDYDRGLVGLYKQFWKYGNTEPIMAFMHPKFSFQDSRPVTAGFQDPRMLRLRSNIPAGKEEAARQAIEKLDFLFTPPEKLPAAV